MAMELWATVNYRARMLAVLIMDKKNITQEFMEALAQDIAVHDYGEQNQITDWLLANQLTKGKHTLALMDEWEHHPSATLRRLYWYNQARQRWAGKTPPDNTAELLVSLEKNMEGEAPEVQWAMNFCAGQIGVYEAKHQEQCIQLGERLGLYKGERVSKGCTPNYLPEFIRIEYEKLQNRRCIAPQPLWFP